MITVPQSNDLQLTGYFPGVVGKIIELHATYYYENWGFDVSFETQVGRELSEFIIDFRDNRDGFWVGQIEGRFVGSIAILGPAGHDNGARLRWLIADPAFHGQGIGNALLGRAIQYCRDKGYKIIYLWTFEGLDTARHLYEREGFRLSQEREVYQWGRNIKEQMFELTL
jgi:GNAT superfamily N-acetyltransferase